MNAQVAEVLPITSQCIAEFNATEAGLAELRQRYHGAKFDCTKTEGDKEARQARSALVSMRTTLEGARKALKEPLLARGKLIDDEAKRIAAAIKELEDPIDAQIKAEEARKAAAKAERERAEAERFAAINAELDDLRGRPLAVIGAAADALQAAIDALAADTLERFDEVYLPSAQQAKDASLDALRRMHAERLALDEQRAELEQQAREQAERAAAEEARQQEQAREAEAAALVAEHIRDIENTPMQVVGKAAQYIEDTIGDVEAIDTSHSRFGTRRVDADAAKVSALSRLRTMHEAQVEHERQTAALAEQQRQLDEQAAALREREAQAERERLEAAEKAEQERRDREKAEAAEREQARMAAEEQAIALATLRDAATEALALLDSLGQSSHIATRKLTAALAREPQE